jgi:3-oxoacyl-[acyl-carrier-protein] synthase II
MGVVSPVGNDVESFWGSLSSGKSGIGPVTLFDVAAYPTKIAGEVKGLDFSKYIEPKEVRRTDRVILLAVVAAREAMKHANIDMSTEDPHRCATIIGAGIGGIFTLETEHKKLLERGPGRVSPFLIPMMIPDMPAGRVSMEFGLKGANFAVVSACASSAHSIGEAYLHIKTGMADVAVTGGTEAPIVPIAFAGFCSMGAMSRRNEVPEKACSPFDKKRDGFVMGEGAAIVVLESLEHALARNATIYGELLGYGATGDAYHLTAPDPEGTGMQKCMEMAMKMAALQPAQIDYINAHGTSTDLNDKIETAAIKKVLGASAQDVAISSTKSMTGHMLGAAGAIEFIATLKALNAGLIPPTINYEDPDPDCDLFYTPNTAVARKIRYALSNSLGFGGHNACLALGRYASV